MLLIAAGLFLDLLSRHQLQQAHDEALLAKARALVTLTNHDEDGIELEFADEFMPEFEAADDLSYFQLWLADGSVLERSRSLGTRNLERFAEQSEGPRFVDDALPDGRAGRQVEIAFAVQVKKVLRSTLEQQVAILVVAEERERLNLLIMAVHLTLLATALVVIMLSALLVRIVIGVGLRPLIDVKDQVALLDADALNTRLALPNRTEELEGLVDQFNALLDRLQAAFQREKRFTADAAHELRTPLAELRNLAAVGRRWPDDRVLVEGFFQDVLDATVQMERLVANLLALAQQEEGEKTISIGRFNLAALVKQVWQDVRTQAESKGVTFVYDGPEVLLLDRGRDQWLMILVNLISNAVTYSADDGDITCALANHDQILSFTLANKSKDPLTETDLASMFDRFWRKDQARTDGHHAGLGLALVKAYADQLGLTVDMMIGDTQVLHLSLSGRLHVLPISQGSAVAAS